MDENRRKETVRAILFMNKKRKWFCWINNEHPILEDEFNPVIKGHVQKNIGTFFIAVNYLKDLLMKDILCQS